MPSVWLFWSISAIWDGDSLSTRVLHSMRVTGETSYDMAGSSLACEGVFLSELCALHFAPERCLRKRLPSMFRKYETADISGKNVDHRVDMCNLPFTDGSFDVVIASHVHYIRDEASASCNLRRILRLGGMAILPVPVFSDKTVEYPEPIDTQMRAPGRDYFDRCRDVFGSLRLYSSKDFGPRYQTWIYEDRSHWPPHWSLRPCSEGEKHPEYLPVCFRYAEDRKAI